MEHIDRSPAEGDTPVPRNWVTTAMFAATFAVAVTLVPWYGFRYGYHAAAWVWFALMLGANGMSITCGYHRLFAHATYDAHPILKIAYLLFGAMALQNSALVWCAGHRAHHRSIDDPLHDPYCARRGFWFSHIGWMLHHHPSGIPISSWCGIWNEIPWSWPSIAGTCRWRSA